MTAVGEWRTLVLLGACYAVWLAATAWAGALGPWLADPLIIVTLTLHSSLQHEALHGHPFVNEALNGATVFPAVGLFFPYRRFKALHLAHHRNRKLTDPDADPESWYVDPARWERLGRAARLFLRFNNTLLGRMLLGPMIAILKLWRSDLQRVMKGERAVIRHWLLHAGGLAPVVLWLSTVGEVSAPGYMLSAYLGLSVLNIRAFAEHRAHASVGGRSVIIEGRGPLAWLFLNNNLHAVHHARPTLPWYEIPEYYRANRRHFLKLNRGYRFGSYAEVFVQYLLRPKDPVAHPMMETAAPAGRTTGRS